jgi:hypothetical protein
MEQPDFTALVEASRMAHVKTGEHNLWKAAMHLPAWFFVATGAEEDAVPVVGIVDGKPHLLAFTDEEQAEAMAKRRAAKKGSAAGAGAAPILNMDVADAVAYCKDLIPHGVEGVLFNSGVYAFQASLSRIIDMHRQYTK